MFWTPNTHEEIKFNIPKEKIEDLKNKPCTKKKKSQWEIKMVWNPQ